LPADSRLTTVGEERDAQWRRGDWPRNMVHG
jgi:hypothetical protein